MITPELKSYVQNLKSSGYSNEQIASQLRTVGWQELDIASVLNESAPISAKSFFSKYRISLLVLLIVVTIVISGVVVFSKFRYRSPGVPTSEETQAYINKLKSISFNSSAPTIAPYSPPVPKRETPASPEEIKAAMIVLDPLLASSSRISSLNFIHSEEYKGIPIKWTAGQPIPTDKMVLIKKVIDIAPEYYLVGHPPLVIISATKQELGIESPDAITLAFVIGTNMFIHQNFISNTRIDEKQAIQGMLHEMMHVAQYYELLKEFNVEYLKAEAGNTTRALFARTEFLKDFGRSVGWGELKDYGNELAKDAESQKTTWYGKFIPYEDQAETAAGFFSCNTSEFSQARIAWMEKVTGKKASDFCPPRF